MAQIEKEYGFPVFGTQGGGLVREITTGVYEFVEAPNPGTGLKVGDLMPKDWGIIAANKNALRDVDGEKSDREEFWAEMLSFLE